MATPWRAVAPTALRAIVLLAAPTLAFLSAESAAQAAEQPSVVVYVEGQDGDSTREEIVALVPGTLRVIEPGAFAAALRKAGQRGQMGNTIAIAKQRGKILAAVRKATAEVGASAAIIGRIRKTRTLSREVYLVYVTSDSDLPIDKPVPLDDSAEKRAAALKETLSPELTKLAPRETTAPDVSAASGPPKESAPAEGDEGPERTPHDVATAAIIADLSFQVGGRYFKYSDGITSNLRPYDVFGAPTARAAVEIYPLAFARNIPIGKDIGLTASYAAAIALTSATQGGEPIKNSWTRFGGGLRGRVRLGDPLSAILGVNAGFHLLRFSFETTSDLAKEIPDVDYTMFRFGVDARIPISAVAIEADAAFLAPMSGGAVYDRFRDASVLGVEARAGLAIPLPAGFELRAMGEYTRFFSAFAPVPGDPYVAGGALDELVGLRFGAAYAY